MSVAGAVLEVLVGALAVVGALGVLLVVGVVIPLAVLAWFRRRQPTGTREAMEAASRLLFAPLRGAGNILETRGRWMSNARSRTLERVRHGIPVFWMALLAPLACVVLLAATVLGVRTEMATLRATNNPSAVQWWLTFAIFATGFVGGTLLLEALGVTHFMRQEEPVATPEPHDDPDHQDREEVNDTDDKTPVRAWLSERLRGVRRSRVGVAVFAIALLVVPLYAVSTGATKRADASVNAQLMAMGSRGVTCGPDGGATVGAPPTGGPAMSEARALSECTTIAETRTQNRQWGIAGALGMVALDIVLGWSVIVTMGLGVAAAIAGLEAVAAVLRGATRFLAQFIYRLHQLWMLMVELVEGSLPRDGPPVVDLTRRPEPADGAAPRDDSTVRGAGSPGATDPGSSGNTTGATGNGSAPTNGASPPDGAPPRDGWRVPPQNGTPRPDTARGGPRRVVADPANSWA